MPFGITATLSSASATGGSRRNCRSSRWHPANATASATAATIVLIRRRFDDDEKGRNSIHGPASWFLFGEVPAASVGYMTQAQCPCRVRNQKAASAFAPATPTAKTMSDLSSSHQLAQTVDAIHRGSNGEEPIRLMVAEEVPVA